MNKRNLEILGLGEDATREQIEDLTEEHNLFSVSALGSIDKLTAQLEAIRTEQQTLEQENQSLEESLEDALKRQSELETELETGNAARETLEQEKNAALRTLEAARAAEEIIALFESGNYRDAAEAVNLLRAQDGERELEQFPTLYESYKNAINRLSSRGYHE